MVKMLQKSSKPITLLLSSLVWTLLILAAAGQPSFSQAAPVDDLLEPGQVAGSGHRALLCDPNCGPAVKESGSGGGGGGGSATSSDIYGAVTDLTTGQPNTNMFVFVSINGILLRTDTVGAFSLTGLGPGTYEVTLQLPEGYTLAQPAQTVVLGANMRAPVDLQYYSGPAPALDSGSTPSPTIANDGAAANQLPDSLEALCPEIYVVQTDDWLSRIAERFLGDVLAFDRIVEATSTARAEEPAFAEIVDPNVIEPGFQLCIPAP